MKTYVICTSFNKALAYQSFIDRDLKIVFLTASGFGLLLLVSLTLAAMSAGFLPDSAIPMMRPRVNTSNWPPLFITMWIDTREADERTRLGVTSN